MSVCKSGENKLLAGANAIIMGGAGALGAAIAASLLWDGASVTLVDASRENLQVAEAGLRQAAETGGGQLRTYIGDAADEGQIQEALHIAAGEEQSLSLAVSVLGGAPAGVYAGKPLIHVDSRDFVATMNHNVIPAFLLLKYAAPLMMPRRSGSVVVISSIASVLPATMMAAYGMGKAALDMLVRCSADELGSWGIRVNAVRPGLTMTKGTGDVFASKSYLESYLAEQALKRTGEPTDVANMVRFLLGPESSWVTGQCMNVDGGLTLHRIPKRNGELFGKPMPDEWKAFQG